MEIERLTFIKYLYDFTTEKIGCPQGLKNREISDIGCPRNDNHHRLSIPGNIAKKSVKSRVETRAEKPEDESKKSAILLIYRWFFGKIGDFFFNLRNLIRRPYLNFWGSDGPNFTRVFVKASNGQICDSMVENQSSLYPRVMKCFQRLYEDLMVKFEPNFDLTVKINL